MMVISMRRVAVRVERIPELFRSQTPVGCRVEAQGPKLLLGVGHLVDGTVPIGMGNSWEEQVFEGMIRQTWGAVGAGMEGSLEEKPSAPARGRGTGPTTPKHPRPQTAWRERTWASWRETGPSGAAPPPHGLWAATCLPGTAIGSSREWKGAVCLPQSWHHQQAAGAVPPTAPPQAAWR